MAEVIEKTENKKGYKKTKLGWIPEEWDIVSAEDVSSIVTGGTPSKNNPEYWENGNINWMNSSEVNKNYIYSVENKITKKGLDNSNTKILPINTIMIALNGQGKTRGMVAVLKVESSCNQSLAGFICNNKINYLYLFFYLQNMYDDLRNITGDGSRTGLNLNILRKIRIISPQIKEQAKIAEILSAWDEGIETLEKLIEQKRIYKKYLMQKLLVGKDRLKNCLIEISEKNLYDQIHNVLSVTNSRGFINQDEQFERSIASKNLKNYKIVHKGEFAYNPSRINVGSIDLLTTFESGIVSPIYVVFKTDENKLLKEYFKHYFKTQNFFEQMKTYTQGGVRDSLNFKNLQMMRLNIPSLERQRRISKILNSCDEEIQLLTYKLEKLKEQKKGLMQKLLTGQIRVKL